MYFQVEAEPTGAAGAARCSLRRSSRGHGTKELVAHNYDEQGAVREKAVAPISGTAAEGGPQHGGGTKHAKRAVQAAGKTFSIAGRGKAPVGEPDSGSSREGAPLSAPDAVEELQRPSEAAEQLQQQGERAREALRSLRTALATMGMSGSPAEIDSTRDVLQAADASGSSAFISRALSALAAVQLRDSSTEAQRVVRTHPKPKPF